MNWVQYEVWAEDDSGHTELIETTASKKDALTLAENIHTETKAIVTVYEDTNDGDYALIKEFSQRG
jgi:hypothetical protein